MRTAYSNYVCYHGGRRRSPVSNQNVYTQSRAQHQKHCAIISLLLHNLFFPFLLDQLHSHAVLLCFPWLWPNRTKEQQESKHAETEELHGPHSPTEATVPVLSFLGEQGEESPQINGYIDTVFPSLPLPAGRVPWPQGMPKMLAGTEPCPIYDFSCTPILKCNL